MALNLLYSRPQIKEIILDYPDGLNYSQGSLKGEEDQRHGNGEKAPYAIAVLADGGKRPGGKECGSFLPYSLQKVRQKTSRLLPSESHFSF